MQCTQEEWNKFYPPTSDALSWFDKIKYRGLSDVNEAFMCLNLNKEQSTLKPNYYSGIDIAFIPCKKIK